jgi:hypothetical protein
MRDNTSTRFDVEKVLSLLHGRPRLTAAARNSCSLHGLRTCSNIALAGSLLITCRNSAEVTSVKSLAVGSIPSRGRDFSPCPPSRLSNEYGSVKLTAHIHLEQWFPNFFLAPPLKNTKKYFAHIHCFT